MQKGLNPAGRMLDIPLIIRRNYKKTTAAPAEVSAPLTEDNDNNHGGLIVVIAVFCLALVVGSFGIRLWALYTRRLSQSDDSAFFSAVILAWAQLSVALAQVRYGWGKTAALISESDRSAMAKTGYVADILYIIIIGLSKLSTALFYQTIVTRGTPQWIGRTVVLIVISWGSLGALLCAVRCSGEPWFDIDDQCPSLLTRWRIIAGVDIALEIVLLAYPVKMIRKLQIPRLKKLGVILILSCRVILIPSSAVHLHYIEQQIDSSNPTLKGAFATVTAELHIALSLVILVAPSMKPFVAAYEDAQGLAYTARGSRQSQGIFRSKAKEFLRRDLTNTRATESVEGHGESQSGSAADNRIIKKVEITVDNGPIELQEIRG